MRHLSAEPRTSGSHETHGVSQVQADQVPAKTSRAPHATSSALDGGTEAGPSVVGCGEGTLPYLPHPQSRPLK